MHETRPVTTTQNLASDPLPEPELYAAPEQTSSQSATLESRCPQQAEDARAPATRGANQRGLCANTLQT